MRRDHLISHLLAALSAELADKVIFFGGTALSRTFVPDGRLSEDIDLIATGSRHETAGEAERLLVRGVRREFPGLRWDPPLSAVRDTDPAVLRTPDLLTVRVQLLDATGYPPWPTCPRELEQRYSDAPPATLTVPTVASFAGWKTTAWDHRRAARDLYDLWSLVSAGGIDVEAVRLYQKFGPTGLPPAPGIFDQAPEQQAWVRDLSAQTRLEVTAAEALEQVSRAWSKAKARAGRRRT
ncbi:nucleotidyl transferase AbiEii/AbiGii toxin family protein [Actinopolymorpha rutila]|uniref:Nucleotidyl transferase AbiEii toxin, Type IV TA system n=1 Tax=Actinopolymorpha rutila TaxID=446787 RepID=A0A852Z5L0_9ACTN|nr:hypothetical protein [Actinopolymorpha rutila]